jgi:hypothetical protein
MVSSPTAAFPGIPGAPVTTLARERANRHRRITAQAGHALEKLGHAIDYLTDEYIHKGGTFHSNDPEVQAVELLIALNLKVYFACPQVPTFGERIRAWLTGHAH